MTLFLPLFVQLCITLTYVLFKFVFRLERSRSTNPTYKATGYIKTIERLSAAGYVLALCIFQTFWITANFTRCASVKLSLRKTMLYASIPNIIIFSVIFGLLFLVPSWKNPFANTFGYALTQKMCKQFTIPGVMKKKGDPSWDEYPELKKMIENNPSLLINELTPENFQSLTGAGMKGGNDHKWKFLNRENKGGSTIDWTEWDKTQWKVVACKDSISEFIWLFLGSFLILSTQLNALQSAKCKMETTETTEKFENMSERTPYYIRE